MQSLPNGRDASRGDRGPAPTLLRLALAGLAVAVAGCAAMGGADATGRGRAERVDEAGFGPPPRVSEADKARGYFLAAMMARFDNDYDTATREITRAVEADPRHPRLRSELVELSIRAGELRRAREQAGVLITLLPGEVEPRLLAARLDIALQDFPLAIAGYREVLAIDADNEESLVLLGALYSRVGQNAQAVEVLRRATSLSPESFITNYGLGKALAAAGDWDAALRSLRHAARLNASVAELHLYTGLVYERLGMREKAIDSFNRAIDFSPELEQARRQIGPLDADAPDLAARLRKYERLIEFAEDPLVTCEKIALSDFQRGDYMRAITGLHIVLGAKPGEDEMRYWLALAYDKVGDSDGTARELAAISPKAPRYVDSRLFLSSVLEEKGDLAGAVAAVDQVLAESPDNLDGLRRRIALQREQKRYDLALATAQRLVALDPKNDAWLYGLAWLYDESGDKQKSIETLRRVLEINPQNADALNHLGYTFAERGENIDEAESLIRRALEVNPDNAAYIDSLAWVHYQRGDYAASVRELEKARAKGGNDPVIVEHLGDVYLKVGRELDADRCYRDAVARSEDAQQRDRLDEKIRSIRTRWVGGQAASSGDSL